VNELHVDGIAELLWEPATSEVVAGATTKGVAEGLRALLMPSEEFRRE